MSELNPDSLHVLEKKVLVYLRENREVELKKISAEVNLTLDQVRRSIEWLKEKNLIKIDITQKITISLDKEGIKAVKQGLPERQLIKKLEQLGGKSELRILSHELKLSINEISAALGYAKAAKWINVKKENQQVMIHKNNETKLSELEKLLSKMKNSMDVSSFSKEDIILLKQLTKRANYITETTMKNYNILLTEKGLKIANKTKIDNALESLTPKLLETGAWRKRSFRPLNVESPAPPIYSGRKHPVQRFIDEVREIFVSLGFEEIEGPVIQSCFWNFDVLFTPQDHPAREIQDTFYIKDGISSESNSEKLSNNIANVHESGGKTGSKGWGYKWNPKLANKLVMRTHTTSVTVKHLADNIPKEAKVFSIGRVFRNEKVTFKNLVEFHQIEGIVVGKEVTLRDLMGLLTKFYHKLGLKKVKFWPSFFPYTEPSLQSMVYHEGLSKWIELCGMGIFRPEVTLPLGVNNPVLAWGGGLERLVMLKYGIDDVRKLYENDLDWLRRTALCP